VSSWFRDTPETRRFLAEERLIVAISELLTEALEKRGITQADLCERLGVKPSEISQRLSGRRNLTLRSLADMLYELGYELNVSLQDTRTDGTIWHERRSVDWPAKNMRYTTTDQPIRIVPGVA
jgi:transcriptional regulator with XRE-family HTH domain